MANSDTNEKIENLIKDLSSSYPTTVGKAALDLAEIGKIPENGKIVEKEVVKILKDQKISAMKLAGAVQVLETMVRTANIELDTSTIKTLKGVIKNKTNLKTIEGEAAILNSCRAVIKSVEKKAKLTNESAKEIALNLIEILKSRPEQVNNIQIQTEAAKTIGKLFEKYPLGELKTLAKKAVEPLLKREDRIIFGPGKGINLGELAGNAAKDALEKIDKSKSVSVQKKKAVTI
jgi:predicted unusual protein kinase regulating ubiquinone biosynthesis (AarF/ABC1/UbiB family)